MPRINFDNQSKTPVSTEKKITVWDVYVLDCSGSMGRVNSHGSKLNVATEGVWENIEHSRKEQNTDNKVVVTLFDSRIETMIEGDKSLSTLDHLKDKATRFGLMTALNDAIGKTITNIKNNMSKGDKVIFKVFTDGGENNSTSYTTIGIRTLIAKLEKQGWTFTFVGTKEDTRAAIQDYNLESSNTLTHDNTAKGFEKVMATTQVAMANYSTNLSRGLDVSKGFFKDVE